MPEGSDLAVTEKVTLMQEGFVPPLIVGTSCNWSTK